MTELRRANHLWSSDSIHLRKVLYIPLDKTPRAHELTSNATELLWTAGSSSSSTESYDSTSLNGNQNGTSATLHSNSPASTICRIPVSQLSFFPPSSKPSALPPSLSPSRTPNTQNSTHPYPTYSKNTHNATSPSLSSILTALPIAASTRDTIIARLSFDSVSSSYSDRDRERDEEGEGHELDDVRIRERVMETPKARVRPSNVHWDKKLPSPPPSPTHSRTTSSSGHHLWESVSNRVHPDPKTPIRTVQLEPSPVMQLPVRGGSQSSKARGSLRDVDFDLEGYGAVAAGSEIGQ